MQFTSKRYAPLAVGLTAKFTLWRDVHAASKASHAGHSHLDAQAEMNNSRITVSFGTAAGSNCWISEKPCVYRRCRRTGWICAEKASSPAASSKAPEAIPARDIALPYEVFHAKGLTAAAPIESTNRGLEIRFLRRAFAGR